MPACPPNPRGEGSGEITALEFVSVGKCGPVQIHQMAKGSMCVKTAIGALISMASTDSFLSGMGHVLKGD